tara:strand:+ start:515 stop:619 length:105 start_codon:yes stop_codon:yes gene_type:complete
MDLMPLPGDEDWFSWTVMARTSTALVLITARRRP